jgi:pyruvate formate lyase activating enzyme
VQIAGYLKTSFIEWPGKISSVIFVPGCNFGCPFCYNADLVDPIRIKRLKEYSEKSILADLKARKKWIDGVVVTGGESLLQSDLAEFLKKVKELGFEIMIETNGSKPEVLEKLIANRRPLINFIAMDFKTTFANYARIVRYSDNNTSEVSAYFTSEVNREKMLVKRVKRSIRLILESGLPYEFRTTVVPTIHDEKVLLKMARELKELSTINYQLSAIPWVLQAFQPKNCLDPKFLKIKPFAQKQMEGFLGVVQKVIPGTRFR